MREFVGSDGKVFAVAWNGPAMPDLRQTLGRYFDHYVTAAVVQAGGHMPPGVAEQGAAKVTGSLIFGIDTAYPAL